MIGNINSLSQWFMYCGNNAEAVKDYEFLVLRFYMNYFDYDKSHSRQRRLEIMSIPLMQKFYEKEMQKFNKQYTSIFLKGLLPGIIFGISVVVIFACIYAFRLQAIYKLGSMDDAWYKFFLDFFIGRGNDLLAPQYQISRPLVLSIILGVVTIIGVGVLSVVFRKASLNKICRLLAQKEDELKNVLDIIPAHYRSYEKMDTLARIYYQAPEVTLQQAFDTCDVHLRDHSTQEVTSVMFDLPFTDIISQFSSRPINVLKEAPVVKQEKKEEKKPENPYLPKDISTKTFAGSDDAQRDMDAMIGLESVKQQVEKLKNRIAFYGKDAGSGSNHMVFMGSAGTGKTTVARIITKILFDLGYIKENKCIEISGDYLKSPYNGQTGERTQAIVEYSYGGVLFIDEAYLLYENSNISAEATGVLLKAMEDHRKDFIVILAGYEEQMTKLLVSNEGFASRIKHKIFFPDYTVEEMYQIFIQFISKYNNKVYLVEDSAKDLLMKTFELEKKSRFFGNARTVRNAVDSIMDYYADRCVAEGDKSNVIKYQDVELYAKDRENELSHEVKNTSAANQLDESIIRLADLKQKVKAGSENPDNDFNLLVGLDDFKNELNTLYNQKLFYGDDFKANQINISLIGPHGCGKSSLVKVLTGYLYQYNIIKNNQYLEISSDFLKGSYVGHTTKRAESIISYASGGVLYIKNLNLLTSTDDSFGSEALTAIQTALNSKNDIVLILSDTNNNQFIMSNLDLFSINYTFPQYTNNDLLQIFNIQAYKDGFTVQHEVFDKLNEHMNSHKLTINNIISIYNNTKKMHINNFNGDESNKFVISAQDLQLNSISLNKPVLKLNIKKKGE